MQAVQVIITFVAPQRHVDRTCHLDPCVTVLYPGCQGTLSPLTLVQVFTRSWLRCASSRLVRARLAPGVFSVSFLKKKLLKNWKRPRSSGGSASSITLHAASHTTALWGEDNSMNRQVRSLSSRCSTLQDGQGC